MADLLSAGLPILGSFVQHGLGELSAKRERDWQEYMYNEYNSPSALVRQYDEAGINPALMFGGQTPAAPSESPAAAAPDNPFGTVTGMLAQLLNLDQLAGQKDKTAAEADAARAAAEKDRAEAAGQRIENEFKPDILRQSLDKGEIDIQQGTLALKKVSAEIDQIRASVANTEEDTKLKAAQQVLAFAEASLARMRTDESFSNIGVNNANALLISQERASKEFDNYYYREFGVHPSDGLWPQVIGTIRKTSLGRHDLGVSAKNAAEDLKGALIGLGASALKNAESMSEKARDKWLNFSSGFNMP